MARARFSMLKSLCNSTKSSMKPQMYQSHDLKLRPSYALVNRNYHTKETQSCRNVANTHSHIFGSQSLIATRCYTMKPTVFSPTLPNSFHGRAIPLVSMSPISKYCSYSSSSGSNTDKGGDLGVPAASGASEGDVSNDLVDKAKQVWQSALDAATYTGQKAKEASVELSPYVDQFLASHPYLKNVIVPVSATLTGTVLAWVVLPRLLRRIHKYAIQGPAVLLPGSLLSEQVPYEKSFWGALEDPVRYLITFMAFSQMSVVPS